MNTHLQQVEIPDEDDAQPFSLLRRIQTGHSHIQSIRSLVNAKHESGEISINAHSIESYLLEDARQALQQIKRSHNETPIISILAEEQLDRIISTIRALHDLEREATLFYIDPQISEKDLCRWSLKNRLLYCRKLYIQDVSDRTKPNYTGWQRRTLEVQIQQTFQKHPNIKHSAFLRCIHPDLL